MMDDIYQEQPETLTARFERIARAEPDRLYAIIAPASKVYGKKYSEEIRNVTIGEIQNTIDAAAWWFKKTFPDLNVNSPIAYIGPLDLRYAVFLMGADKAGLCLLFLSPRNSADYHAHCMRESNCKTILRDKSVDFAPVQEKISFRDVIAPSFEETFSKKSEPFPYKPDMDKTVVIVHSSGSTGYGPTLWDELAPGPVLNCFPMFHAAGLFAAFTFNLQYNHPIIFLNGMPRAETILEAIRNIHPSLIWAPPSLIEACWEDKTNRETLKTVNNIVFASGPLRSDIGHEIAEQIHLQAVMGTSECGILPLGLADAEDFDYFCFPDLPGMVFSDVGDGLYQLFLKRDPTTDQFHSTWLAYPELEIYDTKDLYTKHPTKPGLWKHAARADSVLLLRNGEKVVPIQLEDILLSSGMIKAILMLGNGQTEVAALIEPKGNISPADLAPYVHKGNKMMPGHARLSQDRILLTDPSRPFLYTPKGTVMRKETLALYKDDIDRLYGEIAATDTTTPSSTTNGRSSALVLERERTVSILRQIFTDTAGLSGLEENDDLFAKGLDSVGVTAAIRSLKRAFVTERPEIVSKMSLNFIYENPSLGHLADRFNSGTTGSGALETATLSREEIIQHMLSKYANATRKLTVVLTGSTGSLGSYLLDSLLQRSDIETIFVVNRTSDAEHRQLATNKQKHLSTDFSRVTFLHCDLSKTQLGLSSLDYKRLQSARLIIHNQWEVNFHLSLASFEPHLAGLQNLIALAKRSAARIFFASSVAAAREYGSVYPGQDVPEEVFDDVRVASLMGYAESKFIAEKMLSLSEQPTTIARIGQIAGPVHKIGGVWNPKEWLPSLLKSSAYLKLLPTDLDDLDWIPVDILADLLVELAIEDIENDTPGCQVYNIRNPKTISWSSLLPTILDHLPSGTQTCTFKDWTKALAASEGSPQIPATTLIRFYEDLASESNKIRTKMIVKNAVQNSKTMAQLGPVTSEWMDSWMKSWSLSQSDTNGVSSG